VLFERAVQLYRELGNGRSEGEALFWIGTFHHVLGDDSRNRAPVAQALHDLAASAGDTL
jgi:hypothetical protein